MDAAIQAQREESGLKRRQGEKDGVIRKKQRRRFSAGRLAVDGMLTALLVLLGMLKLPSLMPGAEFQLSAPYAVCLAAMVGFRRYLGIGICASLIQLMLGTHTVWNVMIAMVFRIAAGGVVSCFSGKRLAVVLAGPFGTACARLVLAAVLSIPAAPLLLAAVPGMVFTAVLAAVLEPVMGRVLACGTSDGVAGTMR